MPQARSGAQVVEQRSVAETTGAQEWRRKPEHRKARPEGMRPNKNKSDKLNFIFDKWLWLAEN